MDWLNYFIFLLGMLIYKRVTAKDTIFVADLEAAKIWKASLDTLEFEEVPLENVQFPVAVDYDPVDHKLYWTDIRLRAISRANLDGTEQQVVVPYLKVPNGLSIDVENRHLYWTDTGTDTIERANMDGSGRQVILQENFDQPRAIVIDSLGGRMFWTDVGNNTKIERANLDGSQRVVLVDTDLLVPNGLAVDIQGNRMYWCDAGLNTIQTTDLDGQNRINLGTFSESTLGYDIHPFDIGVYNDDVYWSDWSLPQLVKVNKYAGRQGTGVGSIVFEVAGGLHIYIDTVNECSSNPCNAGVCSDEINHYTCNCNSTGFEGTQCQISTDECLSYPCLNGGQCNDGINEFSCECVTGFNGNMCQYTSPCSNKPCRNGATCVPESNQYTCQCPEGYTVNFCQTETTCLYPGDIENGHVIQGKDEITFSPGKSLEFLCKDGYKRNGAQKVYCLTDGTWSEENPICVNQGSKEAVVSSSIIYGGGAGSALLIIILIVVLIVVCCRKSWNSTTNHDLPNPAVYYTTEVTPTPKEIGIYNTAYDNTSTHNHPSAPTAGQTLRTPVPLPRPITRSNHIYDDINNMHGAGETGGAGRFPREHPPSYISAIDHKMRENEEHGIDNDCLAMNTDVSVPLYDVPKPTR